MKRVKQKERVSEKERWGKSRKRERGKGELRKERIYSRKESGEVRGMM